MSFMFNMSAWRIWGLALSLIAFDIALITLFFSQPVVLGTHNESDWDFRIAELRKLENKPQTGVAGVEISRDSVNTEPAPTPTPTTIFSPVVPEQNAPVIKPWQMPFGSVFGTQGTTQADTNGQVL